MQTEGESNPIKFSQVFHLMPFNNSFVVTNGETTFSYGRCMHSRSETLQLTIAHGVADMFRLNYG